MTSLIKTDFSKLPNEDVMRLYLEGIQVYEDQVEIMDCIRKKSIEVRNDLVYLEDELKKRKIEIKKQEEEEEEE